MKSSAFDRALDEHTLIWEETWYRFQNLVRQISSLQQFHAEHKYLIMSRSPASYHLLGNIAGNRNRRPVLQVFADYEKELILTLQNPFNPKLMANALLHVFGYFKKFLNAAEKKEFLMCLEGFRQGGISLTVPIQMLNDWADQYDVVYVQRQRLLGSYPMGISSQHDSPRKESMEQRSFLAIQLKGRVVDHLMFEVDQWRQIFTHVDWYHSEDWHLTLKFLGLIEPKRFTEFVSVLQPIVDEIPRFELDVRGLGLFYRRHEPAIIWAGISEPYPTLKKIADTLESYFETVGFRRELRPFTPHITLGRIRHRCSEAFLKMIERSEYQSWGTLTVDQISLMARRLDPNPLQYETLAQLRLK